MVPAAKVRGLFDAAGLPAGGEPDSVLPTADELPSPPVPTPEICPPARKVFALMGQLKEKYRANPRGVLLAGGGAVVLMMCGCGGLSGVLSALLGGKASTELLAAHYPHKPGSDRTFVRKTFLKGGADVDSRWRMVHKPDGTIETIGPPPFNATETAKYRQAGGFVEMGLRDGTWEPVVKIGAKPGEGWERNGRSYTFKEFAVHDGVRCAVVQEKFNDQGSKRETRNWYAKGVGLVKQEDFVEAEGKMEPLAVMVVEGGSEETKGKYDWGPKPDVANKSKTAKREEQDGGGGSGGKVYTVKVEGRTVRVELSEGMAEEIELSGLVYNKRERQIDMKVKRLAPITRKYTSWQYTLLDKSGVSLASSELIHPALSVGQTGATFLYLGPKNTDKAVKITMP